MRREHDRRRRHARQTFTGLYEDVAAISAALDRLQQDTGLDIDIHVDAAAAGSSPRSSNPI